jgi:hypothetical protein
MPAFSTAAMASKRWLLNAKPTRQCGGGISDAVDKLLTVDEDGQCLFMERVLNKFSVDNSFRTSSKQTLRLAPAAWDMEASIAAATSKAFDYLKGIPDIPCQPDHTSQPNLSDDDLYTYRQNHLDGLGPL